MAQINDIDYLTITMTIYECFGFRQKVAVLIACHSLKFEL